MRYIDLSQTITPQTPVFPGDTLPSLKEVASLEQHGYVNYELTSIMHVGTHADGPAHMIMEGGRLVDFPVESFFGRAVAIDAREKKIMGADLLSKVNLSSVDAVLFATGWSDRYGQKDYYLNYPVLSEELAAALVSAGVKMVGMDSPSPDQPPFPVHKLLLKNNIIILENLTNLVQLIGAGQIELFALPLKIEADSALARVVARIQ